MTGMVRTGLGSGLYLGCGLNRCLEGQTKAFNYFFTLHCSVSTKSVSFRGDRDGGVNSRARKMRSRKGHTPSLDRQTRESVWSLGSEQDKLGHQAIWIIRVDLVAGSPMSGSDLVTRLPKVTQFQLMHNV